MESFGSTRPTVTAPEVAQLVAHYLESSFPSTGRLFAKEASSLLARAPPLPPSSSLKPLAAVVEEYAALFSRAGFTKPSQLVKLRDIISTVVTEV